MATAIVKIEKIKETEMVVNYQYCAEGTGFGILQINKKDGDAKILKLAEGDEDGFYVDKAYRKLVVLWDAGEFPDKTSWAS